MISGKQFFPKKVIGLTKNEDPDGTRIVDLAALQASAHAAANACIPTIS